jgi:nitroreductase
MVTSIVDNLLCTTRSVRKRLDFDRPIDPEVIQRCIDISLQAPTGSNAQGWSVVVVTDPEKRRFIAEKYREGFVTYQKMNLAPEFEKGDLRAEQRDRVVDSAVFLAENFERAPVHVIYCIDGRFEEMPSMVQASMYGSVLPAAWSFMLAARARGIGSAWTTIHLFAEKEVSAKLGIPPTVTQTVLFPVAYYKGTDFKPAKRVSPRKVTFWNEWGKTR